MVTNHNNTYNDFWLTTVMLKVIVGNYLSLRKFSSNKFIDTELDAK